MDTKWVGAEAWADFVRSLTDEGWWLVDLCGVDRMNLAQGGFGAADRPGAAGEANGAVGEANGPADERPVAASDVNDVPGEGDQDQNALKTNGGQGTDAARFEIVAQFLHRGRRERATVHVLAGGDPPTLPSITPVWPSADFMEREAFDLVGIVFEGHPNLKRIMLPDEWEGHPLRKDYGVGKIPVEFIAQPFLQFDSPHQQPNSPEAGVTVDRLGQAKVDSGETAGAMSHFDDTKIISESPNGEVH